jgi:septal ring factor EnvC (AmiA/AmiB activator)
LTWGSSFMTERLDHVESQVAEIWAIIRENQQQLSELRSDISTLATIAGTHDGQIERLIQAQAESRRLNDEIAQRFDQFVERSDRDRALMLQLIQNLAQGGNGGN